jgi:hypothetical protein
MCVTVGKDGQAAAVEFRSGRRRGKGSGRRAGCIIIWQGAFLTMEHLLATMVSLSLSPGRMHIHSTRGISNNGALVGDDG